LVTLDEVRVSRAAICPAAASGSWIARCGAWFIKEVPLRGRAPAAGVGETASQQPELVP
jgi:hypothetical protein